MSDSIKYHVRIVSIEPFGNPRLYKVALRIIGTKDLVTITLPVRPKFVLGEDVILALG